MEQITYIEEKYNKLQEDYDKLDKRLSLILKQGDSQGKHLLSVNENSEKLLIDQSKKASMGEMLENIAHQMKQPLSLILSSSSALQLQKEMDILTDDDFNRLTTKISEASMYLSNTIDNFKNFFQNEKSKKEFPLTKILEQSKQLLEAKFKNQDITIVHETNDVVIMGIENELVQVITNLFSNSIDAMENQENHKIIVVKSELDESQKNIIIHVGDSGGGIPADILDNVFNAHFTTKDKDKGSGIGLHMSHLIITSTFKGTIKVFNQDFDHDDNSHSGAFFELIFPIK